MSILTDIYKNYLTSQLKSGREELVRELKKSGQIDLANALDLYFDLGNEAEYIWQTDPWVGRKCIVADNPPEKNPGLLWLDPCSITVSVFVPAAEGLSPTVAGWVDMQPLFLWQYLAFMDLAKWELNEDDYFVKKNSGIMTKERFQDRSEFEFVTNIYHEEAIAIALWFGKSLVDDGELLSAVRYLGDGFKTPEGLMFWDPQQHPDESLRFFNLIENDDIITYDIGEWETQTNIGILLSFPSILNKIVIISTPIKVYDFMMLENSVRNL